MTGLPQESVTVERQPFGSSCFSLCKAEFEIEGTVIIRALGWDDREVARFLPGTWKSVRATGAGGIDLYYVEAETIPDLVKRRA